MRKRWCRDYKTGTSENQKLETRDMVRGVVLHADPNIMKGLC
jgi:hypothetical protein